MGSRKGRIITWGDKISKACKGKKRSEEFKKKASERMKGDKNPMKRLEVREKAMKSNTGQKRTEETKRNISKGNKGKKRTESEETKKGRSERMKGDKNPAKRPEVREKISQAKKGEKRSDEFKRKASERQKLRIGEKASNWQGGLSYEPYSTDWTQTLRKSIRERDHYICKICLSYGWVVHHIDYNKKNCCPDNLITLCNKCHLKTNFKRDYWINYFKNI